ncbi:hypothetical protein B0W81_01850, partial [Prochlorococcus sp. HOT_208_60]
LKLVFDFSFISTFLIILQSLYGIEHWLNRKSIVDSFAHQFTGFSFGQLQFFHKSSGLLTISEGGLAVALLGLCLYGYKRFNINGWLSLFLNFLLPVILVLVSIVRNLSSRTYLLQIFLFLFIFFLLKILQFRKTLIKNSVTFLLIITIASTLFLSFGQKTARVYEVREALLFRIENSFSILNIKENLFSNEPIFYGPGLGATYNRQTYDTRLLLDK